MLLLSLPPELVMRCVAQAQTFISEIEQACQHSNLPCWQRV